MLDKFRKSSTLDDEIEAVTLKLNALNPEDAKYQVILTQLERLHALKNESSKRRVDPNTLANVVAHLVGIGMIIHYEKAGVITSKALSFVPKPK